MSSMCCVYSASDSGVNLGLIPTYAENWLTTHYYKWTANEKKGIIKLQYIYYIFFQHITFLNVNFQMYWLKHMHFSFYLKHKL